MSEIDKMARELLAAEYENGGMPSNGNIARGDKAAELSPRIYLATRAVRTALLTAPPGWKLVPVELTDDMVDAAEDAHMPFGDLHFAITSAILAAPEPK